MTWWEILLIALGSSIISAYITFLGLMIYIGKGMWR